MFYMGIICITLKEKKYLTVLAELALVKVATSNNISAISWRRILGVEEAGVHGENHRPWASIW
jgi:hypothetical protein